jgi:DNA polymerase-3 subunit alpha
VYDFCARVDSQLVNKRVLEALVKSGAFDSTGDSRRGMFEALPAAMADGERRRKDRERGQGGLFDLAPDEHAGQTPAVSEKEWDQATRLRFEKEALGLYVSSHPLHGLREQLRAEVDVPVGALDETAGEVILWTGGIVAGVQRKVNKQGGVWLVFRLEDVDGSCECIAWASTYEQYRELLVEDSIVKVKGRLDRRAEDEVKLVVLEVVPFGGVSEYRPLTLTIDTGTVQASVLDDLKRVLADFPGRVPVVLQLIADDRLTRLRVGDGLRVDPVAGLYAELKALLGESSVQAGV